MKALEVCLECGHGRDCLKTSIGLMCRECFHKALKQPRAGRRLYTLPKPGEKLFVVKEATNIYITVDRTLYAFHKAEDAQNLADSLRRGGAAPDARVVEVDAIEPLRYVLSRPELRLVGIKGSSENQGAPGPSDTKIPM